MSHKELLLSFLKKKGGGGSLKLRERLRMAAERGVVVNSSDRPTGLQGSQSSAGLNPRLGMKCRAYEDWQTGIVHRLSVPSS